MKLKEFKELKEGDVIYRYIGHTGLVVKATVLCGGIQDPVQGFCVIAESPTTPGGIILSSQSIRNLFKTKDAAIEHGISCCVDAMARAQYEISNYERVIKCTQSKRKLLETLKSDPNVPDL